MPSALDLLNLRPLMAESSGNPAVIIGIIDGPVDLGHPAFAGVSVRTVNPDQVAVCQNAASGACLHGTAVAGILCARRGSPAPALCPGCTTLVYPIFGEDSAATGAPVTSASTLTRAIVETVDAGAKIINLSLGVIGADAAAVAELEAACDHACRKGVILVVASGNQGRIGFLPLLRHPWAIPVAGCDVDGRLSPESNVSLSVGTRGLRAPGVDITTTLPAARYARIGGTSVAAAFVTGALALLWSERAAATGAEVRGAALGATSRVPRSIVPPILDVERARALLKVLPEGRATIMDEAKKHDAMTLAVQTSEPAPALHTEPAALAPKGRAHAMLQHRHPPGRAHVTGQVAGGSCPTCEAAAGGETGPPSYVYALGTISTRFPSPSIEKEFTQSAAAGETASLTDQQVLYNTLKEHRHLAHEVCWIFSVETVEVYILVPRDVLMLDQFIESIKPGTRGLDVDVVIGTRGPMAPPEMCNGLTVPLVIVDRLYSFDRPALVNAIPKPEVLVMSDEEFRASAGELFERIQQIADNTGATDEHRALNYLAVRYPAIYNHEAQMNARDFSLASVNALPSRLSGTRKLYDIVLSYRNRTTDVVEKYYVRVDVTEKYPYLDRKLSPYYERD
jgi:hypothetical protein